mgnify:FL=1
MIFTKCHRHTPGSYTTPKMPGMVVRGIVETGFHRKLASRIMLMPLVIPTHASQSSQEW